MRLRRRLRSLERSADRRELQRQLEGKAAATPRDFSPYRGRVVEYAHDVLGVDLTPAQADCLQRTEKPPYKVIVRAANIVGKTLMAAVWLSYVFDTREPSFTIVTAPREETIRNTSWRELRKLRARAGLGGFCGPRSLEMRTSESHVCLGTTAANIHAFKGKHEERVFILLEEAAGIDQEVWEACETMLNGIEYGQLCILNPLSTSCAAFREERSGAYSVVRLSALDHPNIAEELANPGKLPRIPSAVRLAWVERMIRHNCDKIDAADAKGNDFEFPVGSGQWWHPNMEVEVALLGLYPSQASDTLWSEQLFDRCRRNVHLVQRQWKTTIGVDVARFGDDMTVIVVRRGLCIVHVESHNGWDGTRLAGRLKELCEKFKGPQKAEQVRVYLDDTGAWGSSAIDQAGDFNFIGINASMSATDEKQYYRMRTELWFKGKEIAEEGLADLSRLSDEDAEELLRQLSTQTYKYREQTGQKWCTEKDKIKSELGRSPDLADAFNLCWCTIEPGGREVIGGSLA